MNKSFRLMAAGALLAVGVPVVAWAQVSVDVQVTVAQACNVSTPVDANFGSQGPTASTNYLTTGSVTLTCNRGAAPLVSVNGGGNFSGTRQMASGGNFVGYSIRQPTISGTNYTVCPATFGAGTAWDPAVTLAASAAFTTTGGPRTVNLCFQTTLNQDTVLGTYTDTVEVSVGF